MSLPFFHKVTSSKYQNKIKPKNPQVLSRFIKKFWLIEKTFILTYCFLYIRGLDYEKSLRLNAKHVESSSCPSYIEIKRWMGMIFNRSCSDNFHKSFRQLECHLRKSNRLKILEGFDINFYPFLRIKTVLKFCFQICQAEQVNFIY